MLPFVLTVITKPSKFFRLLYQSEKIDSEKLHCKITWQLSCPLFWCKLTLTFLLNSFRPSFLQCCISIFLGTVNYTEHKSENATLQYFTFCEKVLDKAYLLKLKMILRHPAHNLSPLVSEICSILCFKVHSLNFAIAHAQKRLLRLSELVIIM